MAKKKHRLAQASRPLETPKATGSTPWFEAAAITVLSGLAIFFASVSWLKWPDPLIDFGRELYLPWRLSQGAVLYKNDLHMYGPLSPYINSLFFRIFGVGLTTLVTANAVIYSAILALLYFLVRAGWGRWAAFTSCLFFIGIFSFSHLVGIDNYNFLTPYSHEMTHGTLLLLCLVIVLRRFIRGAGLINVVAAGLLAGLSVLLKPEIIFGAAAIVAGAVFLIARREFRNRAWRRLAAATGIFLACGLAPMILATLLFWLRGNISAADALFDANIAWVNVFRLTNLYNDTFQTAALGIDHPWRNLGIEILWGGAALGFAGALALGTAFFRRTGITGKLILGALLVGAGFAASQIPWMKVGYALPCILLFGAFAEIVRMLKSSEHTANEDDAMTARVLLWMGATAMLARMTFFPRVFHYGFVQAALAGVVCVAILVSTLPQSLKLDSVASRWYQGLLTLLVVSSVMVLASDSMKLYSYHTQSVGSGSDQFFSFSENVDPTGLLVEQVRQFLVKDSSVNPVHSLLVIPEGVLLNYLTRLPNSIPYYFFAPFVLENGRGDEIIQKLNASPPDRIVVISRDLREFGVERFGDSPKHGKQLVDFINMNYQAVFASGSNDPLNPEEFGLLVLAHKPK